MMMFTLLVLCLSVYFSGSVSKCPAVLPDACSCEETNNNDTDHLLTITCTDTTEPRDRQMQLLETPIKDSPEEKDKIYPIGAPPEQSIVALGSALFPEFSYSLHRGSIADLIAGRPAGPVLQFARVGDRVLHKWHCNNTIFRMLVRNCYVSDGYAKRAAVINDEGCAKDPVLITGIHYSKDLRTVYAESKVFKYYDKAVAWFFCDLHSCFKSMCNGPTMRGAFPPPCASVQKPAENEEDRVPKEEGTLSEN